MDHKLLFSETTLIFNHTVHTTSPSILFFLSILIYLKDVPLLLLFPEFCTKCRCYGADMIGIYTIWELIMGEAIHVWGKGYMGNLYNISVFL